MSYILDALRRADAERERGEVPSLHTQQYGALPGDDEAPRPPRLLLTVIVVLVVALGSALAWNFWGGGDAARHAASQGNVSTIPASVPSPASRVAPVPMPAPEPTIATPPVSPLSPLSTVPAARPSAAASLPPVATSPAADSRHRPDAAAAQVTSADRRRAARAEAAAASAAGATDAQGRLPDAMRRELPTLAFGGASYSTDAASRMVIFNGRVFHEGDTIAPQLVLQQIKLKTAVLAYKGFRYEIEY